MVGVLIIARLGSYRLPGKHLIEIKGKKIIEHIVNRVGFALSEELIKQKCKIIICTSDEIENRKFEEIHFDYPVSVYYGNVHNIPYRELNCTDDLGFNNIISIDGDNVFISTVAIKSIYNALNEGEDLVKTIGLPLGMNVFGYSSLFLKNVLNNIAETSFLETGWGRIFDLNKVKTLQLGDYQKEEHLRFTCDYPDDIKFLKQLIEQNNLNPGKISDNDVINFVIENKIYKINSHLNTIYWSNFNTLISQENNMNFKNKNMITFKERLHHVIPGGAHTYSRGDDQFPSNAPAILERGEGAYVFSPDGEKYLDYGMGLRSVNIGYANKEIADACYQEILKGNNLTRASLTELKAAELLAEIIPSVDMVKFAKHGSNVTSAAMKLARAYTGRKYIVVAAEHPFFSFDDWFIGSTVIQRGIPEELRSLTLKFNYNNLNSLEQLFDKYPNQIAGVMLEAATSVGPKDDFLHQVKNLCKKNNTVFILDEMITGFRWHFQGAQTYFGVEPDLCTFGKAMANGFAVAALAGKREIMQLGGILEEGKERIFLTSTTHGAEMCGLGAFIKTMEILQRDKVVEHFWTYGEKLVNGMNNIAKDLGINDYFYVEGYSCSPNYVTKDKEGNVSLAMRTLFAQEMINQGVMMPYIAVSYAHQEPELDLTLSAVKASLSIYKYALENGIEKYLKSPIIKPVFRKYN